MNITASATPKQARLSALEREVMQIIWALGPATADGVRRALEPERSLKDSTVRTILRRLEAKGFVGHEVDGRTYVYRASIRPRSAAVRAVRDIIDRFCGGSVEELLAGMVDHRLLSERELRSLAEMIVEAESPTGEDHD